MNARDIADSADRAAALDARHSCIVQAPAGSGKTGLLIQRVLRLLAGVGRPEEILAITFTRKAAAEMRRRVLEALQAAAAGEAPPGESHGQLTLDLARAALARDRERGWRLLENPARLRVQTIDSLCASLARQMPVLSRMGAAPAIVENAEALYREAADRTLARVEGDDAAAAAVARLLAHLDGDWTAARALLEAMLARRDQWIRRVTGFQADDSARRSLEDAFRAERARIMARLHALMPAAEEGRLARLLRFGAANLARGEKESLLARVADIAGYPARGEEGADAWCAIAALLLVADPSNIRIRRTVNKRDGFPSAPAEKAFRDEMVSLLQRLAAVPGLCEALHAVRRMPPAAFTPEQWETLGAVVAALPIAAGELSMVFGERGEIDFTGISQAAVAALGTEDDPTDLLLALDVRLQHILVDEFQDTSRSQWDLLTRLTAGWTEGDGRTVFLVGDPMQSIYRFREADVALFLRAREAGLPQVALLPVRLSTNFRSHAGVVEWVNLAFGRVFPAAEDADAGAVPHSPSVAHHPARLGMPVEWHAFVGTDGDAARAAEAAKVAAIARDTLASSLTETVAILVRNRSHLDRIVPALKKAGVPFRAVDIEPLAARPVIQELLAITRALSHPADRVAWLALLRAPWCGLTVAELHAVAGSAPDGDDGRATVWELVGDEARMAAIGAEARARVERLKRVLAPFVQGGSRGSARSRVEAAWLALGGPACVARESDLEDAETYFDQLDTLERAGDVADPALLEEKMQELHAAPDTAAEARVQVMTIHKAKGLEFGTVILPGLDRCARMSDRPLFAWKSRADGTLMMAPVRATGTPEDAAYDYLRGLDEAASRHELERLLYVAATRAANRLHLLGFAKRGVKDGHPAVLAPRAGSLLGTAWSVAHDKFEKALAESTDVPAAPTPPAPPANELRVVAIPALDATVAEPPSAGAPAVSESPPSIEFSWVGETARHVGIVTHRWLQRIAGDGVAQWDAARVAALHEAVGRDLARRGIPAGEREAARRRVLHALEGAVSDERGRWLLAAREGAVAEYRLRVAGPDGVKLIVIDRTFVDADGRRWIVDYKTSAHEGAEPERFLDRELERYRAQLAGYAAAFPGETVALGLYFPLMKGWREVA
jgi:ATP-dependent helicase/nuclease subunit A